ncbi:MAG: SpoIIE family protein phosphatase [Bacteroidales bacterium]|nr:SpoIIE family protein phosphatase [Bacteroidales bacterium]
MIQLIMSRYLFFLLLWLPVLASSQEGTPYITHFKGNSKQNVQNWAICQDKHDIVFFANRLGLLSYDGFRWKIVRMPYTPFQISRDSKSGKIFVGAKDNFGYLERDSKGIMNYVSLSSNTSDIGIITGILFADDAILFYSDQSVTLLPRTDSSDIKQWFAGPKDMFTGIIYIKDDLFINVANKGLHRIDNDTLFPIVTGYLTEKSEILFALPYSDRRVLVGTSDNKLSLFDGIKYYDYTLSNKNYLKENILNSGIAINDSLYAFSTLYGGALVVNKDNRKIIHAINYQNGLPDNEIYAMESDSNEGLWLSHCYGISRVDLSMPVSNFSVFPGLEGLLTSSAWYNNRLYVSTNKGLFCLDEVKNYTEVEVLYKTQPEKVSSQTAGEEPLPDTPAPVKTSIRKVFSRLFSKKEKETAGEITEKKPEIEQTTPQQQAPVYKKRTVSRLQSINWIYRKIDGINTRCDRMVATDNGLIVISGSGIFMVDNLKAKRIIADRNINAITANNEKSILFIGSDNGLFLLKQSNKEWVTDPTAFKLTLPVYSVTTRDNGEVWAGGRNIIYQFEKNAIDKYDVKKWFYHESEFQEDCMIDNVNDTIMLFAETGMQYFNEKDEIFSPYINRYIPDPDISGIQYILSQPGEPWVKTGWDWHYLNTSVTNSPVLQSILHLFDEITSINSDSKGNYWIINDNMDIFKIENLKGAEPDPRFSIFISNITNDEGVCFDLSNLVFEPHEKAISINISAPHFLKETSTQYQYLIEGLMKTWSQWSYNPDINLFLESGDYVMRLRARNILGKISNEKSISFSIKPPFTKSGWFYFLVSIAGIALMWLILNIRQRKLLHDKRVLEQKVKKRTIEIERKKEQIEKQRDKILQQKEEITSSITYARRIQEAILPEEQLFKKSFSDYFLLYKPRDIVSGDFYWIADSKEIMYFAVADCTGHGVPGAIMSMLGISLLNEISGEGTLNLHAGEVLDLLREKIVSSLHYKGRDQQATDGLDIALCKFNKKNKTLEFSGAFNPLYLFRGGKMTEYKADRMPIGYFEDSREFSNQIIKIKKGDSLYIFSDGYYDQFGGPSDKRFTTKKFKNTLAGIVNMPMKKQGQLLDERFVEWKGDSEQIDDIIILRVRF